MIASNTCLESGEFRLLVQFVHQLTAGCALLQLNDTNVTNNI